MKTSWRSIEPKGIEDYLKDLCVIYRGEVDNPHDVNAILDEERKIQILRYHLWDAERSILDTPGSWRFLISSVFLSYTSKYRSKRDLLHSML